jgi:hypothetical protein
MFKMFDLSVYDDLYAQQTGKSNYATLSDGHYHGIVENVECAETKDGMGHNFVLTLNVEGHQHKEIYYLGGWSQVEGRHVGSAINLNKLKQLAVKVDPSYSQINLVNDIMQVLHTALVGGSVFFELKSTKGKDGKTYQNFYLNEVCVDKPKAVVAPTMPPPLLSPAPSQPPLAPPTTHQAPPPPQVAYSVPQAPPATYQAPPVAYSVPQAPPVAMAQPPVAPWVTPTPTQQDIAAAF